MLKNDTMYTSVSMAYQTAKHVFNRSQICHSCLDTGPAFDG